MEAARRVLSRAVAEAAEAARKWGLDFGEVVFEVAGPQEMVAASALGIGGRLPHPAVGWTYKQLKARWRRGLWRAYELVVSTRPVRALVLASRSRPQSLMLAAHVLAHSDFLRHNFRFRQLPGSLAEEIRRHRHRLAEWESRRGRERVGRVLEAAWALEGQVGPSLVGPEDRGDLLEFLARASPVLEEWEREVLAAVRREALYFWAQAATRLLNEGWATYWHTRVMREAGLSPAEALEWARRQADLLAVRPPALNPYLVGYRIFQSLASTAGRKDAEVLFRVREAEDDASFIRRYLTRELVRELDLFVSECRYGLWVVSAAAEEWEGVREELVRCLTNRGYPYLVVLDDDYRGRGELYLRHLFDGRQLDRRHLGRTLSAVSFLWGRPVHLETVVDGRVVVFTSLPKGQEPGGPAWNY
jgi:stage V sporulation protein R